MSHVLLAERRMCQLTDDRSTHSMAYTWRRGVVVSAVRRMNEVDARRARLVHGWVAVFRRLYHLGM